MPTIMVDGIEIEAPPGLLASLPTPPAPAVPDAVTNFQGRAVLRQAGLFEAADAAVAAKADALDAGGDPISGATLREAWDKAQFMRTSPLLAELGAILGVSSTQMDALFIAAASIEI